MGSQARDASLGLWEHWGLWGQWLLLTLLGWVVGVAVASVLLHSIDPEVPNLILNLIVVIVGLVPGAGVGLAQMIAVRQELPVSQRWVWGAAAGMGIPFIVVVYAWLGAVEASDMWLVLAGAAGGALAGLIQAPTLRRHTSRAHWWVLASLVSWGIAWLSSVPWVGVGIFFVGGAVLGVVSGALLIWMVRSSPRHEAV